MIINQYEKKTEFKKTTPTTIDAIKNFQQTKTAIRKQRQGVTLGNRLTVKNLVKKGRR